MIGRGKKCRQPSKTTHRRRRLGLAKGGKGLLNRSRKSPVDKLSVKLSMPLCLFLNRLSVRIAPGRSMGGPVGTTPQPAPEPTSSARLSFMGLIPNVAATRTVTRMARGSLIPTPTTSGPTTQPALTSPTSRSLKCTRVTIHKNLFVSFIINNAMWLVWFECVVGRVDVVFSNTVGCQVLHVFLHYFLVSNYFWMFCEGLYLHTLLVVAFVAEDRIMKWFYMLGWGAPAVFTIIYGACRGTDDEQSVYCWMEDGNYNYILNVPVVLSMLLNLFFLVNIVRVLVTKLRAVNTAPDTHSTRKAVRATLILIPLLGLHYILIPFRPPKGSPAEGFYLVVSAIAASLQGLGVSLLFCFFNGEVLGIFKKKWSQHKLMRGGSHPYVGTTFSYMKSSMADGNTTVTNYGTTIEGDDV
ncbi:calcitonin gene-related peptide type 1 receptor-like isoform X4 [Homarus americanus]|uniref:calcitonin gene-related peptide type 1 receptor-like isoform X4 n=1 Tax=Homarus americanus TaxID=6706 RepID=UPI001C441FFC|nr:calcitonin gene-related peptide type 1 receptor-like isoform X4 [Homarus americanus]